MALECGRRGSLWNNSCGGEDRSNIGGYCNPAVDSLIEEFDRSWNTSRRIQIAKDIQGIVMDDVALNPIYFQNATEAYRKDRFVVPSVEGIFNRWSLLLVDHPALSTSLAVNGPDRVVCGECFTYDLLYSRDSLPIEDAMVNASATPPVYMVSKPPVTTDTSGRASVSFAVDRTATPSAATVEFETSKSGYVPRRWSANLEVSCEWPYGVEISSFTATPACVAPGELAALRATVVEIDSDGGAVEGAIVRIVSLEGGVIAPKETPTDSSGLAEFTFGYQATPPPPAKIDLTIRAMAVATRNGSDYESAEASLMITVDPGGCGRSRLVAADELMAGLAIAIIWGGAVGLVGFAWLIRHVREGHGGVRTRVASAGEGR